MSRHLRRIVEGANNRLDHLLICASAPFYEFLRLINLLSGCRRRVRQGCPPVASDEENRRSTRSPRRSACLSKQACRKAPARCRSPISTARRCSPVLASKPVTGWAETCGLRTGCRWPVHRVRGKRRNSDQKLPCPPPELLSSAATDFFATGFLR